jgi:hypothetical protein
MYLNLRTQAKAAGASNKDANTAAAVGVAMDEAAKQAAKSEDAKK